MRTFRRSEIESPEELAEKSGMPLARAKKLWPLLLAGDVSLDYSRDGGPTLADRLADDANAGTPEEEVIRDDTALRVREGLSAALESLTKREQRIIRERLLSEDPVTLRELGKRMGLSRERVRQLEVSGRAKLRRSFADLRATA
jgi:RNA polymerase sigma-32 factor